MNVNNINTHNHLFTKLTVIHYSSRHCLNRMHRMFSLPRLCLQKKNSYLVKVSVSLRWFLLRSEMILIRINSLGGLLVNDQVDGLLVSLCKCFARAAFQIVVGNEVSLSRCFFFLWKFPHSKLNSFYFYL